MVSTIPLNRTIDSISPLIDYSPSNWNQDVVLNGTDVNYYRNDTAVQTNVAGASAKFSFNGTAIWVYGTKRPDHGKYYVTLDTDTTYLTGEVGLGKDQFQTLLYSATNLTYGLHQITLVNQGFANGTTGVFDVDWIDWETQVPAKASPKISTNNDKSFQFLPKGNWWTYGNDSSGYSGVLYYTQSPTAEFQMDFTGQSVALYGYLNTNHGNYSCGVDGVGSSKLYSGKTPTKEYQQLICYADGLDHGQHTLTVHNVPVGLNTWFSIDYAEVWGDNLDETFTKSLSGGAIAGIVIGGLLAIAALGALVFWFFGRRKTRGRDQFGIDSQTGRPGFDQKDNTPPADHITPYDAISPLRPQHSSRRSLMEDHDGQDGVSLQPTTTNPNDPFGVYAQYSAGSDSAYGGFDTMIHPRDSSYSATTSSTVLQQWGANNPHAHYAGAGPSSLHSAPNHHTRHEQDAGPLVPLAESDEDDDEPEMREAEGRAAAGGTLPPMYSQITGSSGGGYVATQQRRAAQGEQKRAPRSQLQVVDR